MPNKGIFEAVFLLSLQIEIKLNHSCFTRTNLPPIAKNAPFSCRAGDPMIIYILKRAGTAFYTSLRKIKFDGTSLSVMQLLGD